MSRWEYTLPLLESAGLARPTTALIQRWVAAAREATTVGRPGVATFKPTPLNPALRAATEELRKTHTLPIAIAVDGEDSEVLAEFWEQEFPNTRLLLLHGRPEKALVAAMRAGDDPRETLECWMRAGARAIDVYKRNRSRIALIDVACALAAPKEFVESCAVMLGSPSPAESLARISVGSDETADVIDLIAAQMVAQSSDAARILAELEACSLPFTCLSGPVTVDCVRIFRDLQSQQESAQAAVRSREDIREELAEVRRVLRGREVALRDTEARLGEARKKNEASLQQQRQAQEELATAVQEKNELAKISAAKLAENERLNVQVRTLTATHDDQQKRIDDLLKARDQQARSVEKLKLRVAELREYRDRQAKLAADRKAQRDRIRKKYESLEASHKATGAENELLLTKLHQVQEAFEEQFVEANDIRKKLRTAERKIEETRSRLRANSRKLSQLRCILQDREQRIQYLETSVSWRVTKPLRVIRSLFGKPIIETEPEVS